MCDLSIITIGEDVVQFECEFKDCSDNTGSLSAVDTTGDGLYLFEGTSTNGTSFSTEEQVPEDARLNPTKVFKFIAEKLKDLLCPTCV